MTKVARKNVRETVSKCLELMMKGGRFEIDETRDYFETVMQQIRTGTADDEAWRHAMSQLRNVVEGVYPEKQEEKE